MQFAGNCRKCGVEITSAVNAQAWRDAVNAHQCPESQPARAKLAHELEKRFLHSSPKPDTNPPGPKGKPK